MSTTESVTHALPESGSPYFVERGAGEKLVVFDQLFTHLVTGKQTDNQFEAFVTEGRPGRAVPPHFHSRTHEVFYVIEGAVRLWVDDRNGIHDTTLLRAGDFGFVPANVVHSYQVEQTARLFGITGGGFIEFFRGIGQPTTTSGIPEPENFFIPTFEQMQMAGAAHDVTFLPDFPLFD